jgi:hypothetical protein
VKSAAVVVLLLAMLTGCFPAGPIPSVIDSSRAQPVSTQPRVPLTGPEVLAYCPRSDAVHFGAYSLAVDVVYICRGDETRATDGVSTYGPWEAAYQIQHPAALLAAYGHPDNRRKRLCPEPPVAVDPLIIWVHRDGVTQSYYAPVDGCGLPTPAATAAYQIAKRTLLVQFDRGAPTVSQKDADG